MIHYQLRCNRDHRFDGWFRDSIAFDEQARHGLLACPDCGETRVNRALMAPSLGSRRRIIDDEGMARSGSAAEPPSEAPPAPHAVLPDKLRAMLQRLRAEVEASCDYVGADFAAEARRIHEGESERTGIYGEATPDQAEALAEDGIPVARIPWLPRADG